MMERNLEGLLGGDLVNKLIDTKPLLILDTGSTEQNSDHDVLVLYKTTEQSKSAYSTLKDEDIESLKNNKITFYFQSIEDFSKEKYRVGTFGVGHDTGWGKLAPSIKTYFIFNTARVLYSSGIEAKNFIRSTMNKLGLVPLNESYELYLTAKWSDFLEYLVTKEDSKLAKATLRLIYSLLVMDDGKYRNSYEAISKDAHLINMGEPIQYFGIFGEELLHKLITVKKGKSKFTDEERRSLENFFAVIGNAMDYYKVFLNVSGNLMYKKEIKEYIDERIKKFGLDNLINLFDKKIEDSIVPFVYINDLVDFVEVDEKNKNYIDFLNKVKKKYEMIFNFGKNLNNETKLISLYKYLKIKYYLHELNADEVLDVIKKIEGNEIKIEDFVYSIRGFDRSEQAKSKVLYDLYLLLSKVKSDYNDKDLMKKLEEGLIWDPFNENAVRELIKYKKPNFKYVRLNEVLHDKELRELYENILKSHLKLRVETEKILVDSLIENRNKLESFKDENLINYIKVTAFNKSLKSTIAEYKLKLDELSNLMENTIKIDPMLKNPEESVLLRFYEFYNVIYKYEIRISQNLLLEHDIERDYSKKISEMIGGGNNA